MFRVAYRSALKVLPTEVSERIRLCVNVIRSPLPVKPEPLPEPPITYSPRETFAAAKTEAGLGYLAPELLIGASRPNTKAHLKNLPAFFAPLFTALAIASSERRGNILRVLDYGGALGDQCDFANAALGEHFRLDWTVIETSLYVDYARREGLDHVKFFTSIDDAASMFDFALFSGVLQYLENWREPLRHPAVLKSKYILVSRVAIADSEIPFLQTVRMPDKIVRYPGRVMRLSDIAETLSATHEPILGWDLDHHMGELGICSAPAMLWRRRASS
jgi:putative methyltransferase (TIGR04325 family)